MNRRFRRIRLVRIGARRTRGSKFLWRCTRFSRSKGRRRSRNGRHHRYAPGIVARRRNARRRTTAPRGRLDLRTNCSGGPPACRHSRAHPRACRTLCTEGHRKSGRPAVGSPHNGRGRAPGWTAHTRLSRSTRSRRTGRPHRHSLVRRWACSTRPESTAERRYTKCTAPLPTRPAMPPSSAPVPASHRGSAPSCGRAARRWRSPWARSRPRTAARCSDGR